MVILKTRESILIYYNDDHESLASSKKSIGISLITIPFFIIIVFLCVYHSISLIGYTVLTFLLTLSLNLLGLKNQSSESNHDTCDIRSYDYWSLGHAFLHTFFMALFYVIMSNLILAFIMSIIVSLIWELVEYNQFLIADKKNFYCESPINRIFDIIFGIFGSIISYLIIYYCFI